MFEDERSIYESNKQIYGMYRNQFDIIDVQNVDERRWAIGLPPLWYMNKVYATELPYGYETDIQDLKSFQKWIAERQ